MVQTRRRESQEVKQNSRGHVKFIKSIELPENMTQGGFDHAAVHAGTSRLYVAHTCNDMIDVIDCATDLYMFSIPNLTAVAGALVSEERGLVFTSNRGEDTVGIFAAGDESHLSKIAVGIRPNGLSFDPKRGLLLAANVGDPDIPNSFTVSILDVERRAMIHSIPVPGRPRWTIFDPAWGCFYINIADPFQIVGIESANPTGITRRMEIPARGPHGLDFDPGTNRLFCACDAGKLFALEASSGKILLQADLSGTPDVIFFNPALKHLYVAVGNPGVIDLFETDSFQRIDMISTERGAHTLGFDAVRNKVYAFLPASHRACVYLDE
jgi:DNA-binding beta-propeller fold protein YncE